MRLHPRAAWAKHQAAQPNQARFPLMHTVRRRVFHALFLRRPLRALRWHALALLGWATFAAGAIYFAHFQEVVMDEGAYLYKGWLFIRGVYRPFQPYGPWTNKMPLAFFFYGAAQWLSHPGLDTGRYFSLGCGLLALAGVWVLLRRFTDAKTAALVMWMAAATTALQRMYSLAVTEGLGAALLIWALVFVLAVHPRNWQLFLGGLLAGTLSVTRINLIFVWVFVGIFTWKAYGLRRAKWAWLGAAIVPLVVYATYWPDILRLWLPWLPKVIRKQPWFPFHMPASGLGRQQAVASVPTAGTRLSALAGVLSTYPLLWLSLVGATLLAWAWRKGRQPHQRILKAVVLLTWALVVVHAWATIGRGSLLLFNFSAYLSFFAPLFLLLGGITLYYRKALPSHLGAKCCLIASTIAILLSGGVIHKSVLLDSGAALAKRLGSLTAAHLPWHAPPPAPFQDPQLFQGAVVLGILAIGIALGGSIWLWRARQSGRLGQWLREPHQMFVAALLLLGVLSPTPLFSNGFRVYDCPKEDTLAIHQTIGQQLAAVIPPHALVYWQGGEAVTPLLYLPYDVRTFPPQYNDHFNYRQGGDPATVYQWGYWNNALAQQWLEEADVVLLSKQVASNPAMQSRLRDAGFVEFRVTIPLRPCQTKDTRIAVYKRPQRP